MIWFVGYTNLHLKTKAALDAHVGEANVRYIQLLDDYDYGKRLEVFWRRCGDRNEPLAIIEHDIVIRRDVAEAFKTCSRPYCAFPYAWTTTVGPALGCTRFRPELLRCYPDAVADARTYPSAHGLPGHYRQLDCYLMRHVLWRKHCLQPHVHLPPVEHLNPEQALRPDADPTPRRFVEDW